MSFDMVGKQPIVLLKTVAGNRFLPIWIGHAEAAAILMKLQGAETPRPMTHDLLRNLIIELGIQVERVVVTSLRDNTFFAVIEMRMSDGARMVLDSRPSDAIALALRADCPIFVDVDVIKASRNTTAADEELSDESLGGEEEWPDVIGEAGDLPM